MVIVPAAEQQRVAVGRRPHHGFDAKRVAGAAAVLDVELLAQNLAEMQREHARGRVGGAARRGGHQDFDRLGGPRALRLRLRSNGKQDRGSRDDGSKHGRLPDSIPFAVRLPG